MNVELLKRINDVVKLDPESFDMNAWEGYCGTTRCVAGWAVYLTTGEPLYRGGGWADSLCDLAVELGLPEGDMQSVARELLWLTFIESEKLFYTDSDKASHFLHLVGEGRIEEARALFGWDD